MESLGILILVGLTSLGTYLVGTRRLGLAGRALRAVVGQLLEWAGLAVLFFGINLAVGALVILAVQALTATFLPLYLVNDGVVLTLSLLQALAFQAWRAQAAGQSSSL